MRQDIQDNVNSGKDAAFGPSSWKHLLKLLGLMVVADQRIYKETVDAYVDAVMELRVVIDPSLIMTRQMAFDWFFYHKDELMAVVEGLEYDTVLLDIISNFRNLPHKLDVLTAMVNVAIADGDYPPRAQLFVKKTILYWNVKTDANDLPNEIRRRAKADVT